MIEDQVEAEEVASVRGIADREVVRPLPETRRDTRHPAGASDLVLAPAR